MECLVIVLNRHYISLSLSLSLGVSPSLSLSESLPLLWRFLIILSSINIVLVFVAPLTLPYGVLAILCARLVGYLTAYSSLGPALLALRSWLLALDA